MPADPTRPIRPTSTYLLRSYSVPHHTLCPSCRRSLQTQPRPTHLCLCCSCGAPHHTLRTSCHPSLQTQPRPTHLRLCCSCGAPQHSLSPCCRPSPQIKPRPTFPKTSANGASSAGSASHAHSAATPPEVGADAWGSHGLHALRVRLTGTAGDAPRTGVLVNRGHTMQGFTTKSGSK